MLVVQAKCTAQLHAIAARNVEMSGCGNWCMRSVKTLYSAWARIGR